MRSLLLYGREELKGIGKFENLVTIGLLAVAIPVGIFEYGLNATLQTIFVYFAAVTLFGLVFSGREIFGMKNLTKMNSVEQGRCLYHILAFTCVVLGLLYLQHRAVYIFTATVTILMCFATGVSLLAARFK